MDSIIIFNEDNGYWTFQCSFKDRDKVMKVFLQDVLATIASSCEHAEIIESDDEAVGRIYLLKDGAFVKDEQEDIIY